MASRTALLPRKEKETLDRPPEIEACGKFTFNEPTGLNKVNAVLGVLLNPRGHREDIGVEDDVFWRKTSNLSQQFVASSADFIFSGEGIGLAFSSKAITTTAAPNFMQIRACSRNSSSPALRLIELTMHLPCKHLRPDSIIVHFDESIMTGTREMSGSLAIKFKKGDHGRLRIEHPIVHVDVDDLGATIDLVLRNGERLLILAILN